MNQERSHAVRLAIDIGSTVVKVAGLTVDDQLSFQEFHPRMPGMSIADQVGDLLQYDASESTIRSPLICSSANGGLRVGLICLTEKFSGRVFRNQVFRAGANPVYLHTIGDQKVADPVDVLIVGGGVDCPETGPLADLLKGMSIRGYKYSSLVFAGNRFLSEAFSQKYPSATIIENPIGNSLFGSSESITDVLRRAYLDDLVYKAGVSELAYEHSVQIHTTPDIVSRGFQRTVNNDTRINVVGPCILLDIGGATTDVHYTADIVRQGDSNVSGLGYSVNRYVFTDLGIVASADTVKARLRAHSRLYDFLSATMEGDVQEVYQSIREGEYSPEPEILGYACAFLSLDRFSRGAEPGLPEVDLTRIAEVILTGGGAQMLDPKLLRNIILLLMPRESASPRILIDKDYEIWVAGICRTDDENTASS